MTSDHGRFLVLEGLDGAGTTTQAVHLVAACGPHTLSTAEPTRGPVGQIARRVLGGHPDAPAVEALPWLFAADRADHLYGTVLPTLKRGHTVVTDRYVPSSLAYQSLTLPLEQVWSLNQHFRVPDVVLFVDVDVPTALSRIHGRGGPVEIYDTEERLTLIHAAYARTMGFLAEQGWPIVHIDGNQPVQDVANAIQEAL